MIMHLDLRSYKDDQFGSFSVLHSRGIESERVCYFAGFSPFCEYPEHVFYYLEKIIRTGYELIFVSSSPIGALSLARLRELCSTVIEKDNMGVDFGAWKVALALTDRGKAFRSILLANDSIMGPFSDLDPIVRKFTKEGHDLFGLTRSLQRGEHIQSFFVLVSDKVLKSEPWAGFWDNLLYYWKKDEVVENYELNFTKQMQTAGFRYDVWSDWQEIAATASIRKKILKNANLFRFWWDAFTIHGDKFRDDLNPCAFYWRELITLLEFPFLKRELVLKQQLNIEYDVLKNWKAPVSATGYPTDLISQVLSLGEIQTVIKDFPFNDPAFEFHYYHASGEPHFSNFILLFSQKTFIEPDANSYLSIRDPSTGSTLVFRFIYLAEEDIDRIIGHHGKDPLRLPETDKQTYNLLLPYSDDVIPWLQSLARAQTIIFTKYDEYESGMLRFIRHVVPNTGSWQDLSRAAGDGVIDISDLRSIVVLPDASHASEENGVEAESFFEMLNRYHRVYEALPMWYKKIGQVFKIAMGHKLVRLEFRGKRPAIVLKHKKTVSEMDKVNYIKNWYYHEYDVLPGWYKRFGKMINKNK